MKKSKGITLIALIITIIILLILAGITIGTLTGENGLFARAKQARQNTLDAQSAENQALLGYEDTINSIVDGAREDVTIGKEQYEAMTQSIVTMQQEIAELRTEMTNNKTELTNNQTQMGSRLDSVEGQIDEMVTGLGVSTRTTLFNGTAGTKAQEYTISDIPSYKYIVVYSDAMVANKTVRGAISSRIINVQDIIYNNSTTYTENTLHWIGENAGSSYYGIGYWFKDSKTMYIGDLISAGVWGSPRIYKIEGLK